jgi:hypothetical protein
VLPLNWGGYQTFSLAFGFATLAETDVEQVLFAKMERGSPAARYRATIVIRPPKGG